MAEKTKKARVIFAGTFGSVGDVVELTEGEVKAGVASGDLDADPGAVAYAQKELDKAKAKAKAKSGEEAPLEE